MMVTYEYPALISESVLGRVQYPGFNLLSMHVQYLFQVKESNLQEGWNLKEHQSELLDWLNSMKQAYQSQIGPSKAHGRQ